jgi:WD40 repeat protein
MFKRSIMLFSKLFSILCIFTLCIVDAEAQIQLEIKQQNIYETVNPIAFPLLKASLKATVKGQSHIIIPQELLIVDDNRSSKAISIAAPDNQGFQAITWITRSQSVAPITEFVFTYSNQTTSILGKHNRDNGCQVRFCDPFYEQIRELYFGTVKPGQTEASTIMVRAISSNKDASKKELTTRLDSIRFSSPDFSIRWIGSYVSTNPPPVGLAPSTGYFFDIVFTPKKDTYYKEYAVLYYEGGKTEYLQLRANGFTMQENRNLTLLTPNSSNEYTPCEDIILKWKGYRVGAPTYVDFSPDAGKSWDTLGFSMDSTFMWKIPARFTDSAYLRIRQELQRFEEFTLLKPELKGGVSNIAWNASGTALLAGYQNGMIGDWDKISTKVNNEYTAANITFPTVNTVWLGLGYISDSLLFGAYQLSDTKKEILALFLKGNPIPIKEIDISSQGGTKEVLFNPETKSFLIIPQKGPQIQQISLNGTIDQLYSFNMPITGFTLGNGSKCAISFLNGKVLLANSTDLSVIDSLFFPELALINRLGISDDGLLLAMGTQTSQISLTSGAESEVHIAHVPSHKIVRSLRTSSSDAIGLSFNSTNQFLATGFAGIPQISMWQLPLDKFLGSISGHNGFLTDIAYSPDGQAIASSANSQDNVKIRNFSYPEKDTTDNLFRIVPSQPRITKGIIPDLFLMEQKDTVLSKNFCNKGPGNIILEYAYLRKGKDFTFSAPFPNGIVLKPNDCIDLSFKVQPTDTGIIADTVFFGYCSQEFYLPLEVLSKPRNIKNLANNLFLDSLCINDTTRKDIFLIKNEDPVPLLINKVIAKSSHIFVNTAIKDTLLLPGQQLSVNISYTPSALGPDQAELKIEHSNQSQFSISISLLGYGSGANIVAPSIIPFLQDSPRRTIPITNKSENPVNLTNIQSKNGSITLYTPVPVQIPPGQTLLLDIGVNGIIPQNGIQLDANFDPCGSGNSITIVPYSAEISLKLPIIEVDPKERARIPIALEIKETIPYKGELKANIEIQVNPRIFLPDTAFSTSGKASLVKNQIINDIRHIGIEYIGKLSSSSSLVTLEGPAGIAETRQSPLDFTISNGFIGPSIPILWKSGEIRIINLCKDLTIIQSGKQIKTLQIYPNPAINTVTLYCESEDQILTDIELIDAIGNKHALGSWNIETGKNMITLSKPNAINSGAYTVIFRSKDGGLLAKSLIHFIE